MQILTTEQMRHIDRRAIEQVGIADLVLMENAGSQVADLLLERYDQVESDGIVILVGKGNNGGDGLVCARRLHGRGFSPRVVLMFPRAELGTGAATQLQILEKIGLEVEEASGDAAWDEMADELADYEVIVDAILGTGVKGPVEGFLAQVIADVNGCGTPVLAIDIPSGLSGDTAAVPGPAIEADATIALAFPKIPHLFPPAEDWVGEVFVADIGIPDICVEAEEVTLHLIDDELVEDLLPERHRDAHKGDFGHLLAVAGSVGKPGAARMLGAAALRGGAGLVTTATPAGALVAVSIEPMEMMIEPLAETKSGTIAAGAVAEVKKLLAGRTVLAIGPGLSDTPETLQAIRAIVAAAEVPVVLDADGCNAFAGRAADLSGRDRPLVVTPHPGEMGRLLGMTAAEIQADRIGACRKLATEQYCFVVLKGYRTLVGTPAGDIYVNLTGNPGMATGGTGDLLTGLLAGLLCQRLTPLDAALLAVYLHGRAGDLAAASTGETALMAGDLLESLPEAFADLSD